MVITSVPVVAYAANSTPEISLEEFSSRLRELKTEYDENFVSEISIENDSEFYHVDGEAFPLSVEGDVNSQVSDDDFEIPFTAIADYCDLPEVSAYSLDENAEDITVDKETAQDLGFEVEIEDDTAVLTQPYQTKRLIVKSQYSINPLDSVAVVEGYNDLHIVQFDNQESAMEAQEYYENQKLIEYTEPDLVVSTMDIDCKENSTAYANSLITYDNHLSWGSGSIGIDDYIDYLGDVSELPETVVGIIDTGVDLNHEFLKDRIIETGFNISSSGEVNIEDDDEGHGTHVAGIVVDNTTENVKIMSYKVLNCYGNGDISDVSLAIDKAVSDGVNVINMSLGAKGTSSTIEKAINNAVDKGVTVCVAAGNNGADASKYTPACVENCITVAAIDAYDEFPYWTNWGRVVDIIAPGVSIYSTYDGCYYETLSGTSMASPFVAAASAMILCKEINFTPDKVCETLIQSGRDCSPPSRLEGIRALYIGTISEYNGERTAIPQFSIESGKYTDSVFVEITCEDKDAEIYYTLDGSRASQDTGILYTEPIFIDKATGVHAVAYAPNRLKSLQAYADYYITFTDPDENFVIDSQGVITDYLGSNKYLTIPDNISGITVTAIGKQAFFASELVMIKFPDTLTSIYDEAFFNCEELYSVEAKNLKYVGYYAFGECVSLTEIDLSQLEFVDEWGFTGCLSITSIYNDKLTEIKDYSFCYLDSVINIDFPNVTVVGEHGISECANLETINLPKLETLGWCGLSGLNSIVEIDLPNLTTLKTNSYGMGSNFSNCESAKIINIPNYTGELPKSVFAYTGLEKYSHDGITKICDNAFTRSQIKSVELKNVTYIGEHAFYNCTNLETVYIPSVTEIYNQAFRNADNVIMFFAPALVSTKNLPTYNADCKIYLSAKFAEYEETAYKEQNATIIAPKGSYAETVATNGAGVYDNNMHFISCDHRDESIENPSNVTDLGRSICASVAGIRFGFTWDNIDEIESLANEVEYGFIYSQKDAENLSIDTVDGSTIKKALAPNRIVSDGTTSFNLVISNIPSAYYDREITARAYVCIDGMYFYSNILKGSFGEVAELVLADDEIDQSTKNAVYKLLEA